MLRHLAYGWRNFVEEPDEEPCRLNWEFFAVIKGSCAPHFAGQSFPRLKTSALWLLPPQTAYLWRGRNRLCQRAMFQVPQLPAIMTKNLAGRSHFEISISRKQGERILQLAEEIRPFYYHPDETYELRVSHLISELCLTILADTKFAQEVPLHYIALQRVQKAEAFYRENLSRKPSLREVAQEINISESQLRRHFQKVRHSPPLDVFRSLRLDEACRLLRNTTLTNDLVAASTGFNSTIDFYRTFKARFGVTPHYWRTYTKVLPLRLNFNATTSPLDGLSQQQDALDWPAFRDASRI